MSEKIMITGGCGFVGHHIIEHFLKNSDYDIISVDKLTYAARGFNRVRDIEAFDSKRVMLYTNDISNEIPEGMVSETKDVSYILHLAAESHVDNSITDPIPFVKSNVLGTAHLLNFARKCDNLKTFAYFGTDEIFGPAPKGVNYKEWDRYNSTNPYSATKAAAEELCLAWANTYKLPMMITHCMNIFGERQHPEKFIPMCIGKIMRGETVTIHGSKDCTQAGSRFYIHARNVANAIDFLLCNHEQRDKYNIVGEKELSNLELAQIIADILGKPLHYKIVDFHSSRPGHDLRYALDGRKMNEMGWKIPMTFEKSLESTIKWTLKRKEWMG